MAKEPKTDPTAAEIAALDPKSGSKAPTPPPEPARVATEEDLARLAAAAPKDEALRPSEGVVARGHTVVTEEGTFTPGMTVRASKAEVEKMRRRGVMVDPNRIIAPLGTGPRFYKEDEASKGDPN